MGVSRTAHRVTSLVDFTHVWLKSPIPVSLSHTSVPLFTQSACKFAAQMGCMACFIPTVHTIGPITIAIRVDRHRLLREEMASDWYCLNFVGLHSEPKYNFLFMALVWYLLHQSVSIFCQSFLKLKLVGSVIAAPHVIQWFCLVYWFVFYYCCSWWDCPIRQLCFLASCLPSDYCFWRPKSPNLSFRWLLPGTHCVRKWLSTFDWSHFESHYHSYFTSN